MKIVCIADTHNSHNNLTIPDGDILIHAGDFTDLGTKRETQNFVKWLGEQPHKHKIFIAGNHDYYLQEVSLEGFQDSLPTHVHYLHNSSITLEGVSFWGSPQSPSMSHWAFNEPFYWQDIPKATDILITHIPPFDILDLQDRNSHLGDPVLRTEVFKLNLKMHVYGHVHDSYGLTRVKDTLFINASSQDSTGKYFNPPIAFDLSTL